MITKQAKPTLRKPPRRDHESADIDPAKIGATLRELAFKAHQVVRATDSTIPSSATTDPKQELTELYSQIVCLQRNLGAHRRDSLATYVAALRARVEECLG